MAAKVQWYREAWWMMTHANGKRHRKRFGKATADKRRAEKAADEANHKLALRALGFRAVESTDEPNGFLALAIYDAPELAGVRDGLISAEDAVFSKLLLWIDSNHDGVSQSSELATAHLSTMNSYRDHPWELSFSYGRALQDAALRAWKGDPQNVPHAQETFLHRARCNGAARSGGYTPAMEAVAA